MRTRSLAAVLLLGSETACAASPDQRISEHSLVGTWAYVDVQTQPRSIEDCETDFGVSYAADGSFSAYEAAGRWHVEGDYLVETITARWEMGSGAEVRRVERESSRRTRLQWISPNVVNVLAQRTTDRFGLIRCRSSADILSGASPTTE